MITSRSIKPTYIDVIVHLAALSVAVIYFIAFYLTSSQEYVSYDNSMFFNSDALYLSTLANDIFTNNESINSWYLTPAPYFFPDLTIQYISHHLGNDTYSRILIYGIIQILILAFSLSYLSYSIIRNRNFLYASSAISLSVLWLASKYNNPLYFSLVGGYHFGVVIIGIVVISLWINQIKKNNLLILIIICTLTFITSLSDAIYIVQSAIPLSLTILSKIVFSQNKFLKKHILSSFSVLLSSLAGYLSYPLIITNQTRFPSEIGLSRFITNSIDISNYVVEAINEAPIFLFLLVFFFFHTTKCIYTSIKFKDNNKTTYLASYFLLSMLGTISFLIIQNGMTIADRYLIPIFIFPLVYFFVVSINIISKRNIAIFFVTLGFINLVLTIQPRFKNGFNLKYSNQEITCLDSFILESGLSNTTGIAEYWDAKYIQNFSNTKILIAQYKRSSSGQTINKNKWITSKNYFKNNYSFVILNNEAKERHQLIIDELGTNGATIKDSRNCGKIEVYIYKNSFSL